MPEVLSKIERRILNYLVDYLKDNTYQPSIREIGKRFGIKSTKTVSEHLQSLATQIRKAVPIVAEAPHRAPIAPIVIVLAAGREVDIAALRLAERDFIVAGKALP